MLRPPHYLALLRAAGFETFAPVINETYDTIVDYPDRLATVDLRAKGGTAPPSSLCSFPFFIGHHHSERFFFRGQSTALDKAGQLGRRAPSSPPPQPFFSQSWGWALPPGSSPSPPPSSGPQRVLQRLASCSDAPFAAPSSSTTTRPTLDSAGPAVQPLSTLWLLPQNTVTFSSRKCSKPSGTSDAHGLTGQTADRAGAPEIHNEWRKRHGLRRTSAEAECARCCTHMVAPCLGVQIGRLWSLVL